MRGVPSEAGCGALQAVAGERARPGERGVCGPPWGGPRGGLFDEGEGFGGDVRQVSHADGVGKIIHQIEEYFHLLN